MSRISSRSFAVNSNQQQIVELGAIDSAVSVDVTQSDRTLLNCNASIQLAGADIDSTNQLPVINTNASDMEVNSNLRINSLDVDDTNRVPSSANLQINGTDVDDTDRVPCKSTLQIGGVDVSGSNKVPVTITGGVSGSEANLASSSSVISGDTSTAVNVDSDKHNIFGNSTDSTNAINVEISANNSDWYNMGIDIFPDSGDGDFQLSLDMPIQYLRLKFTGTATVTATVISA
jgi:hypothetical protein